MAALRVLSMADCLADLKEKLLGAKWADLKVVSLEMKMGAVKVDLKGSHLVVT
jgi:hypothetical protein